MPTRIEYQTGLLVCRCERPNVEATRPVDAAAQSRWANWAERYDTALLTGDQDGFPALGREIFDWLDGADRFLLRALEGSGPIQLEIVAPGHPDAAATALLDIPWELLANAEGFLASDANRPLCLTRRMGRPEQPVEPAHADLALIFMASAPQGEVELDFEAEEAAILRAANPRHMRVIVEESGALLHLQDLVLQEAPIEALHLSCHGDIQQGQAFLALEDDTGGVAFATATDLVTALGETKPPLVFLSACRTAETEAAATPLTRDLVSAGVPNVLGWDGSVYDADAIAFTSRFYGELAARRSVAYAAAIARGVMLRAHTLDPEKHRHWHLARVYAGPQGGGALCEGGRKHRPPQQNPGYTEFLDKEKRVPVASRAEFVGRRRQLQRILRAFQDARWSGVLIHGMGRQGKSSLAARIADRMTHNTTVVVFENYRAVSIFDAVARALPPAEHVRMEQTWRHQVETHLYDALRDMLEGPLAQQDTERRTRPILLIIDDFEQVLEFPAAGEERARLKPEFVAPMTAVLAAFRDSRAATDSRLLLTSRYTLSLPDRLGADLAENLLAVPLPPMNARERDKQMDAAARSRGTGFATPAGRATDLADRAKAAANGSPGLQALLTRPILAGELDAAEAAIVAVEHFLETGTLPQDTQAADFFATLSLRALQAALTRDETQQMRAALLFSLPVPLAILALAGRALGVADPARAVTRLIGLGLLDGYGSDAQAASANRLARPLFAPLSGEERPRLAGAVVPELFRAWADPDGDVPRDERALELVELALEAKPGAAILNECALAAGQYVFRGLHEASAARAIVLRALQVLEETTGRPGLYLLRLGADCAERLGEADLQDRLLETALGIPDGDARARAALDYTYAGRLHQKGRIDEALSRLAAATETFQQLGDEHSLVGTRGRVADILQARGDLKGALEIRTKEQIPA
jgi:tetratricopeptide (TPR) repeat protein